MNIQNTSDLTPAQWHNLCGKKIHLGVCGGGQVTDEAVFAGLVDQGGSYYLPSEEGEKVHPFTLNHLKHIKGIRIELCGTEHDLFWGDIIEFWPLCDDD